MDFEFLNCIWSMFNNATQNKYVHTTSGTGDKYAHWRWGFLKLPVLLTLLWRLQSSVELLFTTYEVTPDLSLTSGLPEIYGQVLIKQVFPAGKSSQQVMLNLRGLPADDHHKRAIHIHQFGVLSQGCITASLHFNPSSPRGAEHPRHPGDLGSTASSNGTVRQRLSTDGAMHSRGLEEGAAVVREKQDDLELGPEEENKRSGTTGIWGGGSLDVSLWEHCGRRRCISPGRRRRGKSDQRSRGQGEREGRREEKKQRVQEKEV